MRNSAWYVGKNWILSSKTMILRQQTAFTLLELLLALTLSTFVMLTLAMSMSIVIKDWERANNYLDANLDQVLVMLQIERAFTGAFPHTYRKEKENKPTLFFVGEEDTVTWVSTVSPGRKPGLTAWQLSPSEEETGVDIRIVSAFAGDPMENLEDATPIMVFEGYLATFEYLYKDEKIEEESEWEKEWLAEEHQSLPSAVRMRLEKKEVTNDEQSLEMIALILANEHQSIRPRKL